MSIQFLPKSFPEDAHGGYYSVHDVPHMVPGECYIDTRNERKLRYVRLNEDVVVGASGTTYINTDNDQMSEENIYIGSASDAVVSVGSKEIQVIDPAATTNLLTDNDRLGRITEDHMNRAFEYEASARMFALLQVTGGTGSGQQGVITGYTKDKIQVRWDTEDGVLETALDKTSDINWNIPWLFENTDAAGEQINGYAQVAGKAGQYMLVLEQGLGRYLANTAVAAGGLLVPTTGAGETAAAAATTTVHYGRALTAAAADGLGWGNLSAKPIAIVPTLTVPYNRGTTRPGDFTGDL